MLTDKFSERKTSNRYLPNRMAAVLLIVAFLALSISLGIEVYSLSTQTEKTSHFFSFKTLSSFTKEIAFASFIAYVIAIMVEIDAHNAVKKLVDDARQEQEEALKNFSDTVRKDYLDFGKEVSNNLFKAVLQKNLPQRYVNGVVDSAVDIALIRENFQAKYELNRFSDAEVSEFGEYLRDKLKLIVTFEYFLQNVTNKKQTSDIRVSIPTTNDTAGPAKLIDFGCDDREWTAAEIDAAFDKENDKSSKSYLFPKTIDPKTTIHVHGTYTLEKDLSDNEPWTSIFPTIGATLDVSVNVPGLICGVRTLNEEDAQLIKGAHLCAGETGNRKWRLPEIMLPYQGCIFWWRPQQNTANQGSD